MRFLLKKLEHGMLQKAVFFYFSIFIRSFLEASIFTSFSKIETKTSKTIYFRSLFPGSGALRYKQILTVFQSPPRIVIFKYHAIDNDNSVRVIRDHPRLRINHTRRPLYAYPPNSL